MNQIDKFIFKGQVYRKPDFPKDNQMNPIDRFLYWILGADIPQDNIYGNINLSDEEFLIAQKKGHEAYLKWKEADRVILEQPKFDINKIADYTPSLTKKFEFRPETWEQFIGQTEAKERAKTIIKKVENGLKSHFLVDGIKGHGKTAFVELLAKSLNAHLIKRIGKQIDEENLVEIINEINTSTTNNVIFFCDEFDTMNWKVIKVLNPIIESFEIAGKAIKPFIFCGATINKYILLKNNPDTLDRIPTHIKFVRYNQEEIQTILKQYHNKLYPTYSISPEVFQSIANNCKFNPRTSIGLLEEFIVEQDIQKVLKNCHVVKDGLTLIDIKILTILNTSKRAMGANCLALKAGLSQNEYLQEFEPFLVEYDYINRIPSRVITEKGKKVLEEINISGK